MTLARAIQLDEAAVLAKATLNAGKDLELEAAGNITGTGATLSAGKDVEVHYG